MFKDITKVKHRERAASMHKQHSEMVVEKRNRRSSQLMEENIIRALESSSNRSRRSSVRAREEIALIDETLNN